MLILVLVVLTCILSVYLFMKSSSFGAKPAGDELRKIGQSPQKESLKRNMNLVHPRIGEPVDLDAHTVFDSWWEGIH